jgi:hypothetical protein
MRLVCGLGWALATAQAQVSPVQADPVVAAPVAPALEAQGEAVLEPETPSPWSVGLVTSTIALAIGGLSAVLGIWVHRDQERPVVYAGAMSALIVSAVSVGMTQGFLDATGAIQHDKDLERMLSMVNEIAVASGDPVLAELVRSEGGPSVVVPAVVPTTGR